MTLDIRLFLSGPFQNNAYLIADNNSRSAVVIDPSFDSEVILEEAQKNNLKIEEIWLTHAHFDHFAGTKVIALANHPPLPVRLHPADLDLWRTGGNAKSFGQIFDQGPEPSLEFSDGQKLKIGQIKFEVCSTPGHTLGHVVIYCRQAQALFCGDVIFRGSIGRTDLPGGDFETLIDSIHSKVLTLPDETRLLPGHGPESTVGIEKAENPFLA